jgi:allantoin racemase
MMVAALDPPIDEHELDRRLRRLARVRRADSPPRPSALVAQGADVIIPAEGVLNVALVRNGVRAVAGAPVLDSYGSLIALAETMVRLRRASGLGVSRAGGYAKPPAAVMPALRGIVADIMGNRAAAARDRN